MENGPFSLMIYQFNMVIFNSYVKFQGVYPIFILIAR